MIASTNPTTWTVLDTGLSLCMPLLLLASAFFSGSETALFGMSARQRMDLARSHGDRCAPLALLKQPRMLLITLLLGNMVANILYFVLGSVILLHQPWGPLGATAISIGSLLGIILLGEITPKVIASARPVTYARLTGPVLLALHQVILPIRRLIESCAIRPLSRLATPSAPDTRISIDELDALLHASARDGVVDPLEQKLLSDVLALGVTAVRDVMTPRTRMASVPIDADAAMVDDTLEQHRSMRIAAYGDDPDDIRGMLHVKDWLRNPGDLASCLRAVAYIPGVTTVDRALQSMRADRVQVAIVVDEFGGTAGMVTLADLIEPLVGEITEDPAPGEHEIRPMGPGRWIVPGDLPADRLSGALLSAPGTLRAATVAGMVLRRLGRPPVNGDIVRVGNIDFEVHHVTNDGHVETVILSVDGGNA